MAGLRLFLIDDDEDMFVLVRDFLAETAPDWTVEWASTYEAGIAGLTTGNYDAAILDYHLGAHTGVELLESVRTIHRLPPTVLLTDQGDRALDFAAMATSASDYLDKGDLSPILLERTVRHAIEREHHQASLWASEAAYRGLFERAGDAVLIADDTGRYVDANPAACVLLGVTRDEAVGRGLMDFVDPSQEMPDPEAAWAYFLAAGEMRGQVKLRRPDGTIRDADFLATANVTPGRHLSVLRDNTDRLAAQAALIDASRTDPLTGTLNRRALLEEAKRVLDHARRRGETVSVLMIDLDHFKMVNDTYGHAAGDIVLQAAAARMRSALRIDDLLGRWGGEEFIAILPSTTLSQALEIGDRLRVAIAEVPMTLTDDHCERITVSVGCAETAVEDADEVIGRADKAMYRAKRARDAIVAAPSSYQPRRGLVVPGPGVHP